MMPREGFTMREDKYAQELRHALTFFRGAWCIVRRVDFTLRYVRIARLSNVNAHEAADMVDALNGA